MSTDPVISGLLLAALLIATILYTAMIRRRHSAGRGFERRMNAISDNYGRSGLP